MTPQQYIQRSFTAAYAAEATVMGRTCWRVYSCAAPAGLILGEGSSEADAWLEAFIWLAEHREAIKRGRRRATLSDWV